MGDQARDAATRGKPAADFRIDAELVQSLLRVQHPDLAHLPLQRIDGGWDNEIFRLGGALAVRLPRRQLAVRLSEHEHRWLPFLAPQLSLPIPAPLRFGSPGLGYPSGWSVVPWLQGVCADEFAPGEDQAEPFAAFLRSLHVPAPPGAPHNPFRGVPLVQRAAMVAQRMARLRERAAWKTPDLERCWDAALDSHIDVSHSWIHGDLHPGNVLTVGGAISGVIDWGDLAAGDRATDLASIWMLFASFAARRRCMHAFTDVSAATWARARGWAVLFGVVLADAGLVNDAKNAHLGQRILDRVTAGP